MQPKCPFSVCTTTSSIRQLLEYFILSFEMRDTTPPSSSFTNLLPSLKTPLTLGQYPHQEARGRKNHALLSLTNTTTAQLPSTVASEFSVTARSRAPRPWPSPSNQWDWRESWNCSWGRGETSRTYSQGSITVLVRGSKCFFPNTAVHVDSRLTGLVCFSY